MKRKTPNLVFCDSAGKIYDLAGVGPCAMKAGKFFKLTGADLIKLPAGSSFFKLAHREPVAFDYKAKSFFTLGINPFSKKKTPPFALAAFLPPGYTLTYNCAYVIKPDKKILPLFAYAPVVFYKGEFYTTAVKVDRERRQDERCMDQSKIRRNILSLHKQFRQNRLFKHLEDCALINNCPAAKNFFLSRYEAPLPASPYCNSRCLGCISLQADKLCPITQPRIRFVPTPEEIAQIALYHLNNSEDSVVSFGQGCEGEPLLVGSIIETAIRLIRRQTGKGMINFNTNASKPEVIKRLFAAGLDSMRVSINSFQEKFYQRYYRPQAYHFKEVLKSISLAKSEGGFVSINYLLIPGFTDSKEEFRAFKTFLADYKIDMLQWRNLNFDPLAYFDLLRSNPQPKDMLGIKEIIAFIKSAHPQIMQGYFNPSRRRIQRFRNRLLS